MNKIDSEKMKEYKETFDFFDKDKDGILDINDLRELFKSMGADLSDDAIMDYINEVDYDGNGTIEFKEFLLIIQKNNKSTLEDTLMRVFKEFDEDGNGSLSLIEIKKGLESLSDFVSMEEVEQIL